MRRPGLLLVFGVALGLRWGYVAAAPAGAQLEAVDAQGYHILAVNLLAGHGFSLHTEPPFVPDGIRAPAYPLFVAAVYALLGPNPVWVALVQGALDAGTALVLAASLQRLTVRHWPGLFAGLLYALSPTAWRYANALLTEILLAALLALLVWAFVRYRTEGRQCWLVVCGALAGFSILVKPNSVLQPAIVAGAVLLPQLAGGQIGWARAKQAAWLLLVAGLVVLPWLARNRVVFGRWLLSHAFENNLARVSAVATLAQANGERVAPWTDRWEALYSGLLLAAEARYGSDFRPVASTARDEDAKQRQLAVVAGDVIRANPMAFAAAHLVGFLRSWVPQEHRFWYARLTGRTWESLGTPEGVLGQALDVGRREGWGPALAFVWQARVAGPPPLAVMLWAAWLLAYALSAVLLMAGTWRWRAHPVLLWLLWATILSTTFLPGPIAYIRYRVPVAPLLVWLMAAAVARPPDALSAAQTSKLAGASHQTGAQPH